MAETQTDTRLEAGHLVAALAGLAGLVGYVYVFGGLALYIELFRAGVPAGEALDEFPPRRFLLVGLPVAILVAVAFLALLRGEAILSRRVPGWLKWVWPKRRMAGLVATAAALTVLGMAAVAVLWPAITLRQASVTTHDSECIRGAYISTDGNGVNLADGRAHLLRSVPSSEVVALVIGKKLALSQQSITVTPRPCS